MPSRTTRRSSDLKRPKKQGFGICRNSTRKTNYFGKKSSVFIVAGRVRVAFVPKTLESDFDTIRYKAPDGHCDSDQSGSRVDSDKKFVFANDHLDVVP